MWEEKCSRENTVLEFGKEILHYEGMSPCFVQCCGSEAIFLPACPLLTQESLRGHMAALERVSRPIMTGIQVVMLRGQVYKLVFVNEKQYTNMILFWMCNV